MYTFQDWADTLIVMDGEGPDEFLAKFNVDEEGFHEFLDISFRDVREQSTFAAGVQVAFNLLHRKGVLTNA